MSFDLSDLLFREALPADVSCLVEMLVDDQKGQGRDSTDPALSDTYRQAFDAIAADPNNVIYVCCQGEEVVGCFQLTFIPGLAHRGGWRAQVESVRVARSYRSLGIGAVMMDYAVAIAQERGCAMVQLTSDKSREAAHRFYERLGFVRSHEGFKLKIQGK